MSSNTDFTTIHEGFLRDIIDMASKIGTSKNPSTVWDYFYRENKKNMTEINDRSKFNQVISRNIATATKGLTAVFPVIVTEATPLDQAVMISKAVERKCVGMLEMLFASASIDSATNAYDYLSQFHNNLDSKLDWSNANIDDVLSAGVDTIDAYRGGTVYNNTNNLNAATEIAVRDGIKAVQEDLKQNCHYYLDECLSETSVNDYVVKQVFNEFTAHRTGITRDTVIRNNRNQYDNNGNRTGYETDVNYNTEYSNDPGISNIKNAYDMLNKGIIKTDVEKANEAMPSLVIVRFTTVSGQTRDGFATNNVENVAVIGVKAMIHYVKSEDMVNKIMLKNSDRRGLFNFIRATTREISFFKDFLFSVDRAKVDALSKVGKGSTSSVWKLLELRANQAKRNKQVFKNDASCSAIATIVISKEEADLIKKYHRLDIKNPGTLLSIMRGYSFMCAVIVDEAMERVDMLWDDGGKSFETYSFMSLEREESSGMYKKVINMVSKR